VAKGTWYRVGLDYKIPLRLTEKWLKSYTIMAHYEVKGEHYTEYSHVYTSTGGRYQPFALKNREVHRMIAEMPLINDNSHYRVNPFLGFGLNTHESGVGGLIYGVDAAYHYGYNCDVTLKLSRDFVKDNPRVGYIFALGATLRFF
jgi:hypothetical protein